MFSIGMSPGANQGENHATRPTPEPFSALLLILATAVFFLIAALTVLAESSRLFHALASAPNGHCYCHLIVRDWRARFAYL